jgi:hypothetical protein
MSLVDLRLTHDIPREDQPDPTPRENGVAVGGILCQLIYCRLGNFSVTQCMQTFIVTPRNLLIN